MKKMILILIGIVILLVAQVYAYDDGDFQVWNTEVQEFKINKSLKLALEEEFRWGDDASEFYYQHYDLGLTYILNNYLNIGGGYRQVYDLIKGKFKMENEPYINLTLTLKKGGLNFESRNRFEYRHFDYKADAGRYRNKFTFRYPFKIVKFEVQPFLADEILFGFGGTNQFNQNRLSCGSGFGITKNIKAEIYYMLVTTKSSGRWVDANVLGTKLKIVF